MSQKLTLRKVLFLLFVMSLLGMGFWGISLGQNKTTITLENGEVREPWRPKYTNTDNDLAEVDVIISNGLYNSHVDFFLSNVTDWKGYCMNAGDQSDDDKDLKMNKGDQEDTPLTWSDPTNGTGGGQKIRAKWTGAAPVSFTLKVRSYDYGAYGDVTATLYGHPPIVSNTVNIPRDNNNNRISDGWRKDGSENYDASADDETGSTGNNYPGDGFSVFEEYRGFRVGSGHRDTDPAKKDLFVYSDCPDGLGTAKLPGIFTVHRISEHDKQDDRRIDHNSWGIPGGLLIGQKALWVEKSTRIPQRLLGRTSGPKEAKGTNGRPWTPYIIYHTRIYYDEIKDFVIDLTKPSNPPEGWTPSPSLISEMANFTIAHEIGHALGLVHDALIVRKCVMEAALQSQYNTPTVYLPHHTTEYKLRLRLPGETP